MHADPADLREQLVRLSAENAALRAELQSLGRAPVVSGAPLPSRRRRWIGRTLALLLAIIAFALGLGYARYAGTEVAAGFRDNYDPPAVSAPPAPPPVAAPDAPPAVAPPAP